jgi:hypothetical protein
MTAIGLTCYVLLPVAPPRLLPDAGWVDTMKTWSHVGWWADAASAPAGLEHLTDQYAAMPSLHVGWAVWCAWAWRSSTWAFVRRFGWLYPASIATAVVLTANHYVLDVAAGALIAITVCALASRFAVPAALTGAARSTTGAQGAAVLVAQGDPRSQVGESAGRSVSSGWARLSGLGLLGFGPGTSGPATSRPSSGPRASSPELGTPPPTRSGSITSSAASEVAASWASSIRSDTVSSRSSFSVMPASSAESDKITT